MKELFLYRIRQAEKPSKKEKYIRKVMMWIVADIVSLAFASSLFMQALEPAHYEYTRSDVRAEVEQNRGLLTDETVPPTDGRGVHEEGGKAPATPLAIIKKVAQEEGIDWKVLAALFQKETQGDCSRIGDTHLPKASVGCYQISRIYHPEVTDKQAMDLEWSSHWTAKRLKAKAEKWGMQTAVALHNGSPSNPAVQAYLADVNRIIASL